MRYNEIYEEELPSIKIVQQLKPQLAQAAQEVYERWEQDDSGYDEELGEGGICQDIAAVMSSILGEHGIDTFEADNGGVGDQHVWVICRVKEGVFNVDIPPSTYETGGGYSWKKRRDIIIQPDDVYIDKLSDNPEDFEQYSDY